MAVTSAYVRGKIAAIWPALKFVVLSDQLWFPPSKPALIDFLKESWPHVKPPYIPSVSECEEFSISLVAYQRKLHAVLVADGVIPITDRYNWPIGIVCGTRFRGRDIDHWQNICLTHDAGIMMIEPQTQEIWSPEPDQDEIYFLLM